MSFSIARVRQEIFDTVSAVLENVPCFQEIVPNDVDAGCLIDVQTLEKPVRTLDGSGNIIRTEVSCLLFSFTSRAEADSFTDTLISRLDGKGNGSFLNVFFEHLFTDEYREERGYFSNAVTLIFNVRENKVCVES
jgi:hypothetical protein